MRVSPGLTIFRLLEHLANSHGEAFRGELTDGGKLRDDVALALNGTMIGHAAMEETFLRQDDVLALFPIFPGGG